MDWKQFWDIILEGDSIESVLAYVVLMGAGAVVYFGLDVARSTKKSKHKFSWGFMLRDNFVRILVVLLIIVATVLWYDEFFGVSLNAKLAFTQGLSIDALIVVIAKQQKETGALKGSRQKLNQKYKKDG